MTSSGASETDRARNRTSGCAGLTASMTAWPPPPGMWTSTSTTSGSRSPISSTAAAPRRPPRRPRRPSPSSLRTPARKRWWSSTRNTREAARPPASCRARARRPAGHAQLDLGPRRRARTADGGGAAVAGHAALDRLGDAPAVGGPPPRGRSPAPVPDEHRDRRPARPRRTARPTAAPDHFAALTVASRVAASRARRSSSSGQSPDGHHRRRHAVVRLDFPLRSAPPPPPGCPASSSPTEPGAAPSKSHDRSSRSWARASRTTCWGSVGGALDQGQGLEHRVVDPGRHVGPLLGPDRAWRSVTRSRASRSHHGPKSTTKAPITSTAPTARPSPPR